MNDSHILYLRRALEKIAQGPYTFEYEHERLEECQLIARGALTGRWEADDNPEVALSPTAQQVIAPSEPSIAGGAPAPLSSAMIDGLVFKQRRGEPWTPSECGELLDAYQSLMEAYHETAPFRSPEPRPEETAVRITERIAVAIEDWAKACEREPSRPELAQAYRNVAAMVREATGDVTKLVRAGASDGEGEKS